MIVSTSLGQIGRLGNQMFQYAMLLGTANLHGYSIGTDTEKSFLNNFKLKTASPLPKDFTPAYTYSENSFRYSAAHRYLKDGGDFTGYFQSHYYFSHCLDLVLSEFEFRDEIVDACFEKSKIFSQTDVCAIHVRRQDYLTKQHLYPACSMSYYKSAWEEIKASGHFDFMVFSDDIEWCQNSFDWLPGCHFSLVKSGLADMHLMSQCRAHILSNSTFAWWGATLAKSKLVIAPADWFSVSFIPDWQDIYWPHWQRM